jgi:hypothetical protein
MFDKSWLDVHYYSKLEIAFHSIPWNVRLTNEFLTSAFYRLYRLKRSPTTVTYCGTKTKSESGSPDLTGTARLLLT